MGLISRVKKAFKKEQLTSNEVLFDIKLKLDRINDIQQREVLKFDFEDTIRSMKSDVVPTDEQINFIVSEMFNRQKTAIELFPKVASKRLGK